MVRPVAGDLPEQIKNNQSVNTAAGNGGQKMSQYSWFTVYGYTDLRRGIDGLASIIKFNFQLDPYEKGILFLFCGRRSDRIKGLVWKATDFFCFIKGWSLAASAGPEWLGIFLTGATAGI